MQSCACDIVASTPRLFRDAAPRTVIRMVSSTDTQLQRVVSKTIQQNPVENSSFAVGRCPIDRKHALRVAAAAAPAAALGSSKVDNLQSCAVALAKIADDTKALDISLLHVEPIVSWTSYMLLCTGVPADMAVPADAQSCAELRLRHCYTRC